MEHQSTHNPNRRPNAGLRHRLLALAVQAEQGSLGDITFGGLRAGLGSISASSAARYSLTARVWRSGSDHSISSGALPR
jgi:hypothetical protein